MKHLFNVLAVIFLVNCISVSATCDENWIGFNDRCFLFSDLNDMNETVFDDALNVCRLAHEGSRMASVRNKMENDFILKTIENTTYYLGGSNFLKDTWQWDDKAVWNYSAWSDFGEPDSKGRDKCLEIKPGYGWGDVSCNSERPFICAYDDKKETTSTAATTTTEPETTPEKKSQRKNAGNLSNGGGIGLIFTLLCLTFSTCKKIS